jgi:hypothetical protein
VKEEVNIALLFVMGLELQVEDQVMHQVEKLTEAIRQLQK